VATYWNAISEMLGSTLGGIPEKPKKWTASYLSQIKDRLERRERTLDRIESVGLGRSIPDADQITIGNGRHLHLAVMFLDICGFSGWPNANHEEQKKVLQVMNVFMAEMLNIVRDFGGTFEKNTGDGLMAYFGGTHGDLEASARTAVDASVVMHYVNEHLLTPWFNSNGFWPVKFRVGIDCGQLTLARVGIPNLSDQIVAIGSHANIACKLMGLIPQGGIAIGNNVRSVLSQNWQNNAVELPDFGFIYVATNQTYKGWKLSHRLTQPFL
jgi:adenylate cyclase